MNFAYGLNAAYMYVQHAVSNGAGSDHVVQLLPRLKHK